MLVMIMMMIGTSHAFEIPEIKVRGGDLAKKHAKASGCTPRLVFEAEKLPNKTYFAVECEEPDRTAFVWCSTEADSLEPKCGYRMRLHLAGMEPDAFPKALRYEGAKHRCLVTNIVRLDGGTNIRLEPWVSYSFSCAEAKAGKTREAGCIHESPRTSCVIWSF